MISFVKGILAEVLDSSVVVETGGFGMEIFVPTSVMEELPGIGEEVMIYTYFRVSEDAMSLYGFNTRRDLEMFKQLIGVNGIGPKGALAILSTMSPDELRMAIMAGDDKLISTAPGIGPKTAQRVIIDLKDKVKIEDVIGAEIRTHAGQNAASGANSDVVEAIEALVSLGYGRSEAARAVRALDTEGMSADVILKEALRNM